MAIPAYALTPAGTVSEVVITTPPIDSALSESLSAAYVLEAEVMKRRQIQTVAEALRQTPGVSLSQSGPYGGIASARLRGGLSEQTLVLIDGVPVNDVTSPGGGFDFGRLRTEDIERLGVLTGPQSAAFGTEAVSGVINIITKRPQRGIEGFADLEGGGANAIRGQLGINAGGERGGLRASITASDADGISRADEKDGNPEEDGYQYRAAQVRGHYDLSATTTLSGQYLGQIGKTDEDGSGGPTGVMDADQGARVEEHTFGLGLEHDLSANQQIAFDGHHSVIVRDNSTSGAITFSAEGQRTGGKLTYRQRIDRHRLAVGVDSEQITYETTYNAKQQRTRVGVFGVVRSDLTDQLTSEVAVRHDDDEQFGGNTTGSLGLLFDFADVWSVRGRVATGYKSPTLFQQTFFCCGATMPDPNLGAEQSESVDLGLSGQWQQASAGLTLFWQETDDMIDYMGGRYVNIDKVRALGAVLRGETVWQDDWRLGGDLTFTQSDDQTADMRLARAPRYEGNLHLDYLPADAVWSIGGSLRGRSSSRDSFGTAEGFVVLGLRGAVDVNDRVRLYGRLENLLDHHYQEVFGYDTPGREVFVGVSARY